MSAPPIIGEITIAEPHVRLNFLSVSWRLAPPESIIKDSIAGQNTDAAIYSTIFTMTSITGSLIRLYSKQAITYVRTDAEMKIFLLNLSDRIPEIRGINE